VVEQVRIKRILGNYAKKVDELEAKLQELKGGIKAIDEKLDELDNN